MRRLGGFFEYARWGGRLHFLLYATDLFLYPIRCIYTAAFNIINCIILHSLSQMDHRPKIEQKLWRIIHIFLRRRSIDPLDILFACQPQQSVSDSKQLLCSV